MLTRFKHKIDPAVHSAVRISEEEPYKVILYAKESEKFRPVLMDMGIKVSREIPLIEGFVVECPAKMLDKLAGYKRVRYIAADTDVKTQMNIASQVVHADDWHKKGIYGSGIGIALLDTGIFPHPDFTMPRNRIAAFMDIVNGKEQPYDDNGHGTFVAGVAAGSGHASSGVYRGIAPEASIISVKVMDSQGNGKASDVLSALQWVSENYRKYNIKVVSLSLGSEAGDYRRDDAMVKGAEALWNRGITVVVAAGNSGPDPRTITVPGTSPMLLTVGSIDDKRTPSVKDDTIAKFSSRGPVMNRVKPDVVAPGVNIVSVNADTNYSPGGKMGKISKNYTIMSGTSVSTPLVAGMAVLLYQQHPGWSPEMIKNEIMDRATRLTGNLNSEGKGIAQLTKLF